MKLTYFKDIDFLQAVKGLFKELKVPMNYVADEPTTAQEILKDTYKDNSTFALVDDVYFVGMVDDAAFEQNESLAVDKIKSDYDGVLIFGIRLHPRENNLLPTRSQLAEISRAFNREFYYTPVVLVFKYKDDTTDYIAFANTERLKYKQAWREGEKSGKVSLLRDINIKKPHRGHEDIINQLKIPNTGKNQVDSFAKLYTYWQEVFNVNVLNKKFYQELSNWYFWAVKHVTFPNMPTMNDVQEKYGVIEQQKLDDLIQEHNAKNVIRMLTRLLFAWFIKEKKLIPEELFDLDSLQQDILKDISPYHEVGTMFTDANKDSVYYKSILQNLFFASLNCPIEADGLDNRTRGFRGEGYGQNRGIDYLMRYKTHFKNPDKFLEMMNQTVPFLNGGLFECLDDKFSNTYIDGFSDQMTKGEKLVVPDYLFFGIKENVDLSSDYGVKNKAAKAASVNGLINILKSYKFTITENTPIEEDVALDPELLGKVFENLLASYNPETKTTARKQTGSFYTPREIVNYMVDESLIAYLKNNILHEDEVYQEMGTTQTNLLGNESKVGQLGLNDKVGKSNYSGSAEQLDKDLHQLFSFDSINPFAQNEGLQKQIIKALDKCTILDPACGSGAFPMGTLQKMVHVLHKVDPNGKEWKQRQINKVNNAIESLEEIEDSQIREQSIKDLELQKQDIEDAFENNELDYGRKLFLIENCIYGVDIQSIATQISKLRFFISLVVDQKIDVNKDNFGIRPLPNLETKFVAANTLIGIESSDGQYKMDDTPEIKALKKELKKIRHKLFSAKTKDTKLKYRQKDEELRNAIAAELIKSGWANDTADKLASWDPYDQNASSPFFDPEWMFDINDGFDVVIGNPPYVFGGSTKISIEDKKYFKKHYKSGTGKINLFAIFIENGLKLLNSSNTLCYIIPNTLLRVTSYSNIREFIYLNSSIMEVNDLDIGVFEGVTASTIIIRLKKIVEEEPNNSIVIKKGIESEIYQRVRQSEFGNKGYILDIFTKTSDRKILNVLNENTTPLNEICRIIRFGVVISNNFNDVVSNTQPSEDWKRFLEGEEISSYSIKYKGRYLNYSNSLLHRSRTHDVFESDKIMIQRITGGSTPIKAVFDRDNYYNKESIINLQLKSKQFSYHYILALLNSSLINWFYKMKFTNNSKLTVNLSKEYLGQIPVKKVNKKTQENFNVLVDYLLFLKSKNGDDIKQKLMIVYFTEIIDGMVYEVYFEKLLEKLNRSIIENLGELPLFTDKTMTEEKDKIIDTVFKRLDDNKHPVRNNLFFMGNIEEISIIQDKHN
jgi:adenine-specific DNA-methyltransferase